jgi:transglutaminase-like putative cysteine protease
MIFLSFPSIAVESVPFAEEDKSVLVEQKIYLEPHSSNYIFAFNYPNHYYFDSRIYLREDDESGSFQVTRPPEGPLLYRALSWIDEEQRTAFELAEKKKTKTDGEKDFLPQNAEKREKLARYYLQLPESLEVERLRLLAQEITRDAQTAYEKASAIEGYFRENYAYTLETQMSDSEDHLEEFIFRFRAGHCEYFATAMAVLLRIIGIPTRIVSGFYTSEWNPYEGYFIVREQNAHSWVEAWMANQWITFDPTPWQSLPALQPRKTLLTPIYHFLDSVKFKWYRYVIDYSRDDQVALRGYLNTGLSTLKKIVSPAQGILDEFLKRGEEDSATYLNKPMVALFLVFLVGLGISVTLLTREQSKLRKERQRKRGLQRNREVVDFYDKVLLALRRLGFKRSLWQTPREFAIRLEEHSSEFAPLPRLTELYYRVRYNNEQIAQQDAEFVKGFTERLLHLARIGRRGKPTVDYSERSTN